MSPLVVDVDHLVADVVDQRVGVLAVHDVFEEGSALLFAARGVALERIGRHPQRVGRQERIPPATRAYRRRRAAPGLRRPASCGGRSRRERRCALRSLSVDPLSATATSVSAGRCIAAWGAKPKTISVKRTTTNAAARYFNENRFKIPKKFIPLPTSRQNRRNRAFVIV